MRPPNILRVFLALFLFVQLAGCGYGPYPGLPDLPAKNWLSSDKEKKSPKNEKFDFYAPDKLMGMDDLVWLAIQQSPVVSGGRVNLEVQEINKTSAKWRYAPEVHLLYTISNNITRYNEGTEYAGEDYGETKYQLTFSGVFNNPVATFFSVRAADELLSVAIITQRKAIANVISDIARCLLNICMYEDMINYLQESIGHAKKKLEYMNVKDGNAFTLGASFSEDNLRELELRLDETRAELASERSRLKMIVGLSPEQALKLDARSVYKLLDSFRPDQQNWKDVWRGTEDHYLLVEQVKLEQANVMLAWAQYFPNISFYINESPPNGQSQAADAQTDQFMHLTLDFPLLDWGARWRNADSASARQRQRKIEQIQREREYGDMWQKQERDLSLAKTRLERAKLSAQNAARRRNSVEVSFEGGSADMALLSDYSQQEVEKRIETLRAENRLGMTRLGWMHMASGLARHYLGKSGFEQQ